MNILRKMPVASSLLVGILLFFGLLYFQIFMLSFQGVDAELTFLFLMPADLILSFVGIFVFYRFLVKNKGIRIYTVVLLIYLLYSAYHIL